jgi:hypothetical protein
MSRTPITVAKMIAALSVFEPDTLVIVDGYEDGFDDAQMPRLHSVELCTNLCEDPSNREGGRTFGIHSNYQDPKAISAVLISRFPEGDD